MVVEFARSVPSVFNVGRSPTSPEALIEANIPAVTDLVAFNGND